MSQFKKILIMSACVFIAITSAAIGNEDKFTMEDIDGLQHEIVRLDKKLEILKKKVAIKKIEDELNGVKEKKAPSMTSEIPFGMQTPTQQPLGMQTPTQQPLGMQPSIQGQSQSDPVEIKKIPREIVLPKVKSIYGFGKKKKAVLIFSDGSTTEVQEGENFLVDSQKILVSKIQVSGVSVKKNPKGKLLNLKFAPASKETGRDEIRNVLGSSSLPPVTQSFLDSTSNNNFDD